MKIKIDRIEDEGRWRHVFFDQSLHQLSAPAEKTNDIGTRAVRILRMYIGGTEIEFFRKTVNQLTFKYPKAVRAIHTPENLQAVMDRHANTRLKLRFGDTKVRASGISGRPWLKTVAELRECYEQYHSVTIMAGVKVTMNMPTAPRDRLRIADLLPAMNCDDDRQGSCGPQELLLSLYLISDGHVVVRSFENPWALMKELQTKIKKLII